MKSQQNGHALVVVKNLVKYFPVMRGMIFARQAGSIHAVDNVSFELIKGETLGLVGESGCGKSTIGRLILRLLSATKGEIYFEGMNILNLPEEKMRTIRQHMQIIFQDPYGSLNPKMTVEEIIGEPLETHGVASRAERREQVAGLLELVGLTLAHAKRYPHEFSGGQKQRIGIARALALKPQLVVCDEPVSSLDVSIQAQIINLLRDLQRELHLTYMFISHDLRAVKHMCDRVAVMYMGRIVEIALKRDLYKHPLHPYTEALISAIPISHPLEMKRRVILQGDVPSSIDPPKGCRFHTRCPICIDICATLQPELVQIGNHTHYVACHRRTALDIP